MQHMWIILAGALAIASPASAAGPADGGRAPMTVAQGAMPEAVASFDEVPVSKDDFVLGKDDAPVTIIEYASLTCPHCATFHNDVLPVIKKDYIDTGKVKLVYRDFPWDQFALAAAMVARCSGRDRYFGIIGMMFSGQNTWTRAPKPLEGLARLTQLGGISKADFDACLKNNEVQKAVVEQRLEASKKYGVDSTPTLIVNNKRYKNVPLADLKTLIDSLLPKT
jgi:protein-disulfide isomerase